MNSVRRYLIAIALLLALTTDVEAQSVNIAGLLGGTQYDAGGDSRYFTYALQARYAIKPGLRVGVLGTMAHIGDPPSSSTLPGTDETIWRASAFVEFAWRPFAKTGGAVFDQMWLSLRGLLGVFHSSGVLLAPPPPPGPIRYGITDTPTGPSFGGGIGLEFGPYARIRVLGQINIQWDNAYGASLFNPNYLIGVGVDL